jgi:hypothetical protein
VRSLLFAALLLPAVAMAQVPDVLGYQGRMLNADGTAATGTLNVTFNIYSVATGGAALWTENQTLALSEGFYSTFLGSVTPIPATIYTGTPLYLELVVGGTAMTPRQEIGSVAYAELAGTATTATNATNATNVTGGTVQASSVSVGGNTVINSSGQINWSSLTGVAIVSTAPLSGNGTTASPLVIPQATTSVSGYLASSDWNTFNSKLASVSDSAPLSGNGTSGSPLAISQASTSTNGYLSSADWNTFNNKAAASGDGNYIENQNASTQAASFSINSGYFAGNVGIGTVAPTSALTIANVTNVNTGLIVTDTNMVGAGVTLLSGDTGGHKYDIFSSGPSSAVGAGYLGVLDETHPLYPFLIAPTGQVTIGSVFPINATEALTVYSATNQDQGLTVVSGTVADMGIKIWNQGAGGVQWYLDSTGPGSGYAAGKLAIVPNIGSNAAMTITPTAVGIGTSTLNNFNGASVHPYTTLLIEKDVAGGLGPTLTILNAGGGASAESSIDFDTYDPGAANAPSSRIFAIDDGDSSNSIVFQTKVPGAQTNALDERFRINDTGGVRVTGGGFAGGIVFTPTTTGDHQYEAFTSNIGAGYFSLFDDTAGEYRMVISAAGNVALGGNADFYANNTLGVKGNIAASGTIVAGVANPDVAENITASEKEVEAADVVSVDPRGGERIVRSRRAYDTTVIGIISTKPGLVTNGQESDVDASKTPDPNQRLMLEGGAIKPGDLLTSSDTPGHAMKAVDPWRGGIIGTALTAFDGKATKTGKVIVFVRPQPAPAADPQLVDKLHERVAELETRLTAMSDVETRLKALEGKLADLEPRSGHAKLAHR